MKKKTKLQEMIDETIKDTALAVKQSTIIESQGLMIDIRKKIESVYSKEEFDLKFESVHEKLDALIIQTTKTNGRVTVLEMWRSWLTGGIGIITFIVIPLLIYIFKTK